MSQVVNDSGVLFDDYCWKLPVNDWQRIAIRQPRREDQRAVRRLLNELLPLEPHPGLERIGTQAPVDVLLQFINAFGRDFTYAIMVEARCYGWHVRCSDDLDAVRRLLEDAVLPQRVRPPDSTPVESQYIERRNDRIDDAINRLVEVMGMRGDLHFALAWRIVGRGEAHLERSFDLPEDEARQRLGWVTDHVLGMPRMSVPKGPFRDRFHEALELR